MKSVFAETIDKVVEEVLQLGKSVIHIDNTPSTVAGCWEADGQGNEVIAIYLYVNGIEVYKTLDVGTRVYC